MNNFQTIIAKLKTILKQTDRTEVHDKDVALALGITPSTFASMKRRNTIPYKAILDYCVLNRISANALLFHRPVNNLIKAPATIKYYDEVGAEAGAGGGGNVLNENYKEVTSYELLLLFLNRLNEEPSHHIDL